MQLRISDEKHNRKSTLVAFLLTTISVAMFSPVGATASEDFSDRSFEWNYEGLLWTWSLSIPQSLYDTYKSVSVYDRTRNGPAGYGFLATTQDYYIIQVANKLHEVAVQKKYGAYDEVSFVLAFVQSLPYTSDSVATGYDEYPRFPIETLVDYGGDCEDTSILFATLVLILNYSAIFISPPSHYAVGVWGTDLHGYYWTYNNRTYYYCETTGDNWRIGDIPNEYKDALAHLYVIDKNKQYVPSQNPFKTLDPLLVFWLAVGFGAVIIGALYIFIKRAKARKAEETNPKPPPPPPPPSLANS